MLRIALMKGNAATAFDKAAFAQRARVWFEQLQPAGIETVGLYRGLGADAPLIHIFRSHNSREVDKLVGYWREYTIDVYLGTDWLELLRHHGVSSGMANGTAPLYIGILNEKCHRMVASRRTSYGPISPTD